MESLVIPKLILYAYIVIIMLIYYLLRYLDEKQKNILIA